MQHLKKCILNQIKTMFNIAIIGAGQLGSRHLQALANSTNQLHIQVIDPNDDSLKIAETRFNEVISNFEGTIEYSTDISTLNKTIDIVIIATNSKIRKMVFETLIATHTLKNVIFEKVLFTKPSDYEAVEKLIDKHDIKAWVNCPRRMMDFYKHLRGELTGAIHFSFTGNSWGLGCNGIHFIDLFAYLTKTSAITLTNNLIDATTIESKRKGYIEFTGTITGNAGKHSLRITSFNDITSPSLMTIHTETARYSIEEGATAKVWMSKAANNWMWEEQTFTMPFQSQLTNKVVDELLENGTCGLTPYSESAALHIPFLKNLISVLQQTNNNNSIDECLIT